MTTAVRISKGVDAAGHPTGAALVAAGIDAIGVYIRGIYAVTEAELEDYTAHGRWCYALSEVNPSAAAGGQAAGITDMNTSTADALDLHIPSGAILILADDNSSVPQGTVLNYWAGAKSVAHAYRNGGYGPHAICTAGMLAHAVYAVMVAGGWEDGQPQVDVAIKQEVAQQNVGGVTCDVDEILLPETPGLLWNLHGLYADPIAPSVVAHPETASVTTTTNGDNVQTHDVQLTVEAGNHQATAATTIPSSKVLGVSLKAGAGPNIVDEVAWSDLNGEAEIVVKMATAPTTNLVVDVEVLVAD